MFYESLIILNISTLNFSEGVSASVLVTISLGDISKLSEASAGVRIGLNGVPLLARSPLA